MGVLVALPLVAGAALLSSEMVIDNTRKELFDENLQRMAVLEAVIHSDPTTVSGRGGGDITIIGDALLSETGPAGTRADIEDVVSLSQDRISIYVVREGDTLSQIADMFQVTPNTIRWANDIGSKESINPGDTLVILPIPGVQHIIESGDTIKEIAKQYDGDVDEILAYNGLDAETDLVVGDTLTIPNGEIVPPPAPASAAPTVVPAPASSGPVYAGYYMRPVSGGVRTQGYHGYNAVDLASYYGAPIYAAADGEVIISRSGGYNGGYGSYVVVLHNNGTQTLYAHNSSNAVGVGQWVSQGQVIAYMGSSGRSTGTHLHFEIRGATNPF